MTNSFTNLFDKLIGGRTESKKSPIFGALRRAFIFLIPVFIIGASAVALQNFPVSAVRSFFKNFAGGFINEFLGVIYSATYGFAAVYLVLSLSYCLSALTTDHNDIRMYAVINSVTCYFAFLGPTVLIDTADVMRYTNISNTFPAMIVAGGITTLFMFLYKLYNGKHVESVSSFERGMRAILPGMTCICFVSLVAVAIDINPIAINFNDLLNELLAMPFQSVGPTYIGGLLVVLVESILWTLGIHGGNMMANILTSPSRAFAFAEGQIVSADFIDIFVQMGGCGTSICLLIALLAFSKSPKTRKICTYSCASVLFNINEMLIFGLPVVLNRIYIIPFILTPVVCYTVAYLATLWGLMPAIVNPSLQWTTPVLINGYMATGSIWGSVMQLLLLAIGVAIYTPFVLADNRIAARNAEANLERLTEICKQCEAAGVAYTTKRQPFPLRTFEYDVRSQLAQDIETGNITVNYQPQVDGDKIVSAEALLRFRYNNGKLIYPPLVTAIASKNGMFADLSRCIVRQALGDLKRMQQITPSFRIAVNFNIDVLFDDKFRKWLIDEFTSSGVVKGSFGVEITEDSKLGADDRYDKVFEEIKNAGMELLMDDFSMGRTSITVLQKNYFSFIKIDGGLIQNIYNERSRSIVESIVKLGKQLNFKVVAEFVETQEQYDILKKMGCDFFQGYLYYKDMPISDIAVLLTEQNKTARETSGDGVTASRDDGQR